MIKVPKDNKQGFRMSRLQSGGDCLYDITRHEEECKQQLIWHKKTLRQIIWMQTHSQHSICGLQTRSLTEKNNKLS